MQKSRSMSHVSPVKPSRYSHMNCAPTPSRQVAPFKQEFKVQSGKSFSHLSPSNPVVQLQEVSIPGPSMQVPPLEHVKGVQNSKSIPHESPVNPSMQEQLTAPTASEQVPPFWQESGARRAIFHTCHHQS